MIELRLKTALAVAASFAASAVFAQMTPAPQISPQTTGTAQTVPQGGPATSSSDSLVQKRIDDKVASNEYKARKADAKAAYKEEKKAVRANRKTEKKGARAKRKEAMSEQGSPAQTPNSEGK